MNKQNPAPQPIRQTPVKNLEPRDDRNVKAGTETLSINFEKIVYKYTPYD